MKIFYRIVAMCLVSLICLTSVRAQQWERIGWQGGRINIQGQLGNTLIGLAKDYPNINAIYRSTDFGVSWNEFRQGLPVCTLGARLTVAGDYIFIDNVGGYQGPQVFDNIGIYAIKEQDTVWHHFEFSPLYGRCPYSKLMIFSNDTILSYFSGVSSYNFDTTTGFYLSTNGGKKWNRTFDPIKMTPNAIAASPHFAHHRVYAKVASFDSSGVPGKSYFYASNNAGITWELLPVPEAIVINDTLLFEWTSPHQFLRSSDGGRSWTPQDDPFSDTTKKGFIYPFFQFREKIFLAGSYYPNYMQRLFQLVSNDGGITWVTPQFPDSSTYIYQIVGNEKRYIVGLEGGVYSISDSSLITSKQYLDYSGIKNEQGILHYVTGKTLYASHINREGNNVLLSDSIIVSFDNGATWTQRLFLENHWLNQLKWINDASILYAAGKEKSTQFGCIYRSLDNGNSWQVHTTLSTKGEISQFIVRGDTIIVKDENTGPSFSELRISIDGGKSWFMPAIPYISKGIDSIKISYKNSLFLSIYSSKDQYYFSSSDFGLNWSPIDFLGLPPLHKWSLDLW